MINYIDFSDFAGSDDETGTPLRSRCCCCSSSVQLLCRHPLVVGAEASTRAKEKHVYSFKSWLENTLMLELWLWKIDRALPLLLFLSAATSLLHSHSISFSLYVVEVFEVCDVQGKIEGDDDGLNFQIGVK